MQPDVDVLVVGAGPTGLLVASELALAGIGVQVLDRLPEPDTTVKAGSINVATAEILDRRGLLPAAHEAHRRMVREMARFAQARTATTPAASGTRSWEEQAAGHGTGSAPPASRFPVSGHFAAMLFRPGLVNQTDPQLQAHTAVADATLVPQHAVEALLAEHATALGVTVRRGVEVTQVAQHDDGVTLETSEGSLSAGWLVGADGGRSVIRRMAGIEFPGTDPETTGYQAIVDMEGTEALRPGWAWSPTGVYSFGPIPGRILTVQFTGAPADRSAPVTVEELQASIRLVSGVDVTVTKLHGRATRWTDNARQASTYRNGRILLAGDAAHVHSPFSGQGLNLGVGDAINLGWKLAATIAGWAPDGLLDTYTAERHPIGAWVLDWTRAQVALMRGDAKTQQLREVVEQNLLDAPDGMTTVVKLASGIGQDYEVDGSGDTAGVAVDTADPMRVGRLLGDLHLADGSRLADHAHRGTFVLLDRTPDHALIRLVQPWRDRVLAVSDTPASAGTTGAATTGLLVRPDGIVIWTADDDVTDADGQGAGLPPGLERVLRRWAGSPATVGHMGE